MSWYLTKHEQDEMREALVGGKDKNMETRFAELKTWWKVGGGEVSG